MIKIALVGMPNAGKTTLFNLLTKSNALVAPYPFSTVDPNKGIFKLADDGAERLHEAIGQGDILQPEVEVWDIAGLIEGAMHGEGLGNEFLGYILQCDVIVHVIRSEAGLANPQESAALRVVQKEIAGFDHKNLLKPFEKARRMARLYPNVKEHQVRDEIVSKAYYGTKEGQYLRDVLTPEEIAGITDIELISARPELYVVNDSQPVPEQAGLQNNLLELLTLSELNDEEVAELGYDKQPLYDFQKVFSAAIMEALGLKRVYTVGHLGVGLWVAPQAADATECAKLLHTNLEDEVKQVRACTIEDFLVHKAWPAAIKAGKARTYGSKYVPKEGDVLLYDL